MTQQQGNDHDIDVGLEQAHGCGMAEGVRRNPSAFEGGTMQGGLLDGPA
jgi:hypothetical protein